MPSTVSSLFDAAGLVREDAVPWSVEIPADLPGLYVVAMDADPDSIAGCRAQPPIDDDAVGMLLDVRPELRVDRRRPTTADLRARLSGFWLPDETVLYIGLASHSVQARVRAYYRTPL